MRRRQLVRQGLSQRVPVYQVHCNGCKALWQAMNETDLRELLQAEGWQSLGELDLCPTCAARKAEEGWSEAAQLEAALVLLRRLAETPWGEISIRRLQSEAQNLLARIEAKGDRR